MSKEESKVVARNRKAFHDYEIMDRLEAGLVLRGTEVKSMRDGQVSIQESYAKIEHGEAFIVNMDISPYLDASIFNHEPKRVRKLLLHRREIGRLVGKTAERGLTLIPLSVYFKRGFAKVELGLAKGRKLYDKRQAIRDKEMRRDVSRSMSRKR
ncbi:MAG: SsrA-binding protein SmpB [Planctomycetota bacterium]|nr:SsrA-binding protein SmpB [Planctomycetota bacterium]